MQIITYILPEIFLAISSMFLLILGVFLKRGIKVVNILTIITIVLTMALIITQSNETIKVLNESYIIDELSKFMKVLTLLFTIFVLLSSKEYLKINNIDKIEYQVIILAALLGMLIMISSYDLIVFYLGLELQSLCLYILASFKKNEKL